MMHHLIELGWAGTIKFGLRGCVEGYLSNSNCNSKPPPDFITHNITQEKLAGNKKPSGFSICVYVLLKFFLRSQRDLLHIGEPHVSLARALHWCQEWNLLNHVTAGGRNLSER